MAENAGNGEERIRVEELAGRAECSVDTIRFYQKRRLLPAPQRDGRIAWYGPDHLVRLARIRELQQDGFPLAVIRRLLDGELDQTDVPLAAALLDARDDDRTGAEEFLSLETLAARSEVPGALIDALVRDGLLVPRGIGSEPRFTAADVEIVRTGLRLLEAGLPLPELLDLARNHHAKTREVAEAAVAMFDDYVRAPLRADDTLTAEARAERLVDAFRVLLPAVTTIVAHHFRRVLLEVAQEHLEAVGEPGEIAAADVEAGRRLEVV